MVTKKRLIFTFVSMVLSVLTFIAATYAWFAVSSTVQNSGFDFFVDPGIVVSYEIHYYTAENIYKYSSSLGSLLVYDPDQSQYVLPSYETYPYTFYGIVITPYDPLIPMNNTYNNTIIEMHIQYNIEENTTVTLSSMRNISIAEDAIEGFLGAEFTGNIFYLSQVAYLQTLITSEYSETAEGTNLYNDLTSDFEAVDGNSVLIYPLFSFYAGESYVGTIDFDNFTLYAASSELFLYFNVSYYESKILDILATGDFQSTLAILPNIPFFQDITFVVREEIGG